MMGVFKKFFLSYVHLRLFLLISLWLFVVPIRKDLGGKDIYYLDPSKKLEQYYLSSNHLGYKQLVFISFLCEF